jgi:probable HAF family extracellular repeat protein
MSRSGRAAASVLIAIAPLAALRSEADSCCSFTPLGPVSPANAQFAVGLSGDGATAVGWRDLPLGESEAFRYSSALGREDLGSLPGALQESYGWALSDNGSVLVGSSANEDDDLEAIRWTASGDMVGLGDLPGGAFGSEANAVSADGSVVVGFGTRNNDDWEMFRWTQAGGMVGLGDLPGGSFASQATDVSANGVAVVGFGQAAAGEQTFVWTQAKGIVGLTGSGTSRALGVSAGGSVIAGCADECSRAVYWSNGTQIDLKSYLASHGLPLAGWALDRAEAVSDDGTVLAGHGFNPQGEREAFVAAVPEPDQWLTLVSGSALLASLARRRARTR